MTWIKAEYFLQRPSVNFWISDQELSEEGIGANCIGPDDWESRCMELILKHRPELEGGIIMGMLYDICKQGLFVSFLHASFKRIEQEVMPPVIPLSKAEPSSEQSCGGKLF